MTQNNSYLIVPDPDASGLTKQVQGIDQLGKVITLNVVEERPLTIWLNGQEIVTAMTIGDYPEYLAEGFLINQGMLSRDEKLLSTDYDEELQTVVVRTDKPTDYEEKLKKKIQTSGCAVGTLFGGVMDALGDLKLPNSKVQTSWLYSLAKKINQLPSLYLSAGAIHGTVLCQKDQPLVYMEDVGRHNAVDKVAGWMRANQVIGSDKVLYTTGRLTSEMVIKCALMGIPILASRSGFTAWAVELAERVGLTLIGRMRGQRFQCLAGNGRLVYDVDFNDEKEDLKHKRKSSK
ncbi:MAG: formate dehydrogenase accessory sulfurtransferase FdhD [Planktomarina sp.]|jgi:FdhD protein|nr:formate dehydrogenase accessory sulfurtransferase FdhD [Planktomarina sp.]MDT2017255.1 formate dehydrogenase accessory sulfurtransferase FdhD [Planktomarina sp.]MDV3049355.1 formate dehydrogenase accessory sulfurtransferase FdhD [Planktomarina sp.]